MTNDATAAAASSAKLRWGVYAILIAVAVGNATGRIMAVNSVDMIRLEAALIDEALDESRRQFEDAGLAGAVLEERLAERQTELQRSLRRQRPFLSSNDRSRWAAVRAPVEKGTFAIDEIVAEPGWDTIDMVQHQDRGGFPRLYSSKPPLSYLWIAAEYWAIQRLTGATLGTHPHEIGRFMLFTINVPALLVVLVVVALLAERIGRTDWGRIFVVASAALGTFLTTFVVVLNNHSIAAASAAVALYCLCGIWCDGETRRRYFAILGLAAAFTAANELPALAFLAALGVGLAWRFPKPTALAFAPAALLVAVAFIGTNYLAHDSLRPPYMHRSDTDPNDNWYDYTYVRSGVLRESYWRNPQGIDRGEPSRAKYSFHVLVGHHGVFSLTPIWLLSAAGIFLWIIGDRKELRELALFVAAVSLACLVFYLSRVQVDRNYGGMASCFRWVLWFAPLWLVVMLPAADRVANRRAMRTLALVLLALSVLSASYPTWNPWTHPWLADWMLGVGLESFH